jgi:hypothetical protein
VLQTVSSKAHPEGLSKEKARHTRRYVPLKRKTVAALGRKYLPLYRLQVQPEQHSDDRRRLERENPGLDGERTRRENEEMSQRHLTPQRQYHPRDENDERKDCLTRTQESELGVLFRCMRYRPRLRHYLMSNHFVSYTD